MALATSLPRESFGALLSHPGLQIGDQRRAQFLADGLAPFGALSVDHPLDVEQGVNQADRFQRQGRDIAEGFLP